MDPIYDRIVLPSSIFSKIHPNYELILELAKRGYQVTGIDLSANMLNRAKEKAKEANVEI
ncbi:MAG: class I SAM-dependent methyltransferase [Prolixibacteraceae bacterium]